MNWHHSTLMSLFTLLLAVRIAACTGNTTDQTSTTPAPIQAHATHAHGDENTLPAAGLSLHQLDSLWTDQFGKSLRLADFAGQIVVLAMVYTHCDHACPRIIADMRRIRAGLERPDQDVVFLLASIDPERDTVQHLHQFGEKTGLSDQGWRLLRAADHDVRELAAVLGVQFRRTSATDFAHSNVITVLGRNGEIHHQQEGLGTAPDATVRAIDELLSRRVAKR